MVSTSVPRREAPGSLLAHPIRLCIWSLLLRLWASSRSPHAGWVNRRISPSLRRVLQPLRDLGPWIRGQRVGIRGPAAQRASSTHPTAPGAELYFGNGCSGHTVRLMLDGRFYSDSISAASYACIRRVHNSTYMSVPAQPHRYHQDKPAPVSAPAFAPAPASAPLSIRFLTLGISTWEHNDRCNPLYDKRSECSRRSRCGHSRAL
jgi:hypothetical protein